MLCRNARVRTLRTWPLRQSQDSPRLSATDPGVSPLIRGGHSRGESVLQSVTSKVFRVGRENREAARTPHRRVSCLAPLSGCLCANSLTRKLSKGPRRQLGSSPARRPPVSDPRIDVVAPGRIFVRGLEPNSAGPSASPAPPAGRPTRGASRSFAAGSPSGDACWKIRRATSRFRRASIVALLLAGSRSEQVEAYISIDGPAAPVVSFRSVPPLPEKRSPRGS